MTGHDTLTDILLAGPRGRRLLLAYAERVDERARDDYSQESFSSGVFYATYRIDTARGTQGVLFGPGADRPLPEVTPEEVARRLAEVPLPSVTETDMRAALEASADSARYWQEPDGEDVLAGTEPMRQELRRVAEHLAASDHTRWWTTGVARADQWSLGWGEYQNVEPPREYTLARWRDGVVSEEVSAARDRPADPTARWSGIWWSAPLDVPCTTRTLVDGSPAGLWFVEDSSGETRTGALRHSVPDGVDVFEIDGSEAWAELCRRFPLEVTAQKRHDWYRTTGRNGRWVLPDWSAVAGKYGGVHLTVAGYLTAATTAIDIDDDTASVIAGWEPDATFWLVDDVRAVGDLVEWARDDHDIWSRCSCSSR